MCRPSCVWRRSGCTELPSATGRKYPEESGENSFLSEQYSDESDPEAVETDGDGEEEDVPAGTEAGHGECEAEEADEPEEAPDRVAAAASAAHPGCHLQRREEAG